MRLRVILLAGCALALSGCFSRMVMKSNAKAVEKMEVKYSAPLEWHELDRPAVLQCRKLCGSRLLYQIPSGDVPLFLDLPNSTISDRRTACADSAAGGSILQLVVATHAVTIPYGVDSSGSPTTAFLLIIPQKKAPTKADPWASHVLYMRPNGVMADGFLELKLHQVTDRDRKMVLWQRSPLFLLSVPLDVATSPAQLFWAMLKGMGEGLGALGGGAAW